MYYFYIVTKKINIMNQEEKEMIGQLENMIKEKGTVLIAMVHPHVYGPLRGLNFILQNPSPKVINHYMMEGCESISTHTWKETGMAARPMVLPHEMISDMETPPIKVNSIREGEDHIKKIIAKHTLEKDPWYFRMGVL
jgi:hypothetical protein